MALTEPVVHQLDLSAVRQIPATLVRGGTSKCWIFRRSVLPSEAHEVDRVLVRAFGSPDLRQIDGVGGASSTTSKAVVIEGIDREGVLEYTFAQVSIDRCTVEWASNCGNCATAVGLYALHSGLLAPSGEVTRVVIRNTVTGLELACEIPTPDKVVPLYGARHLHGQHYPGVPVDVIFRKASWASYGEELPTGSPIDEVELDGRRYPATLIDAGAPAALFDARALGLSATDGAALLEPLVDLAPRLRAAAARTMNLPLGLSSVPKVGIIGPPPPGEHGVSARMISMRALHPAIGLTSAVAIAAASGVRGSVVQRHSVGSGAEAEELTIHVLTGKVRAGLDGPDPSEISFQRSARVVSEGTVLVPHD
jgi:2-methylaconitate cis-trans-isomerase PrpF